MQGSPINNALRSVNPASSSVPATATDAPARTSGESVRSTGNPHDLPTRVSPLSSPTGSRVSLPSSSRAPDTGISATPNLRQSASFFFEGIAEKPSQVSSFAAAAQGGNAESLKFVAQNVNPNYYTGLISNGIGALMGGQRALRQNCVYCSKAVDQNLEALASGTPQKFWVASSTSAGDLPHENNVPRTVRAQDSIEEMIKAEIAPGRRGIISVPQRGAAPNHAMNVVRADSGAIHVIDGQNGKLYDLSNQIDQQAFNTTFGHNGGPCFARFFDTGEAPKAPTPPPLTGGWVRV